MFWYVVLIIFSIDSLSKNPLGSATACVLGIDCDTGQLHSVNIGDSGYGVVRNGRIVYRSRSQKMNGDCPRQLDVYPWTASLRTRGLDYTQISYVSFFSLLLDKHHAEHSFLIFMMSQSILSMTNDQ